MIQLAGNILDNFCSEKAGLLKAKLFARKGVNSFAI